MTYVPCIVTDNSVSLMVDGDMKVVTDSHINYSDIRSAIAVEDFDRAVKLLDLARGITEYGQGAVEVRDGQVYYNGQAVHNTLTVRIIRMKNEGFNVGPMLRFLENLLDNPSHRAVNELYGFMEASNLPITEDGHFLAYKMVTKDFKDMRTGTFDNSPGSIVEMPRNAVDEDKDRTCSSGLHFCSRGYLGRYGGELVVILKINPRDVVAIPSDYHNAKGRACRYEVLREAEIAANSTSSSDEYTTSVVSTTDPEEDDTGFVGARLEVNGTVTALFTITEAADRICGEALNPVAALRKRISRGTVVCEKAVYVRCKLTAEEEDEWRETQELEDDGPDLSWFEDDVGIDYADKDNDIGW